MRPAIDIDLSSRDDENIIAGFEWRHTL